MVKPAGETFNLNTAAGKHARKVPHNRKAGGAHHGKQARARRQRRRDRRFWREVVTD